MTSDSYSGFYDTISYYMQFTTSVCSQGKYINELQEYCTNYKAYCVEFHVNYLYPMFSFR